MPEYLFQRDDGEKVTRFYAVGRAPKIGRTVTVKGRRLTRLACISPVVDNTREFVSLSQPRYIPGKSKHKPTALAKEYTRDGKPVFRSKNAVREYMAQVNHNSQHSEIRYD